jgi:uncharacterized NAD-dependent epimerase/dehydratase family protein
MKIDGPYLLFIGDAPQAKTALGVRDWRRDLCAGQLRFPGAPLDLGLPDLTPAEAKARGVRTMIIGAAPAGGQLPANWLPAIEEALSLGIDVANGLHARLVDDPALVAAAAASGARLLDVRHPPRTFPIPDFAFRPGRRLLTVGADCGVGKKYTALAIERAMKERGRKVDFRATGQTGILIAGEGVAIDAVVSDFVSAAAASLSPAADPDHWDVIEGQGSLFHPAYAGVTLGLVHGSQPDLMVLCADPSRDTLGYFPAYPQPSLADCVETYTRAARLTHPRSMVIGASLNTASFTNDEAAALLRGVERELGLPCVDPIRTGVAKLVDAIEQFEAARPALATA